MGKNLLLCHLVPEPATKPVSTGGVSGAANAPHQREEEPGLDELLQAVELLLGYRPSSLQVNGEIYSNENVCDMRSFFEMKKVSNEFVQLWQNNNYLFDVEGTEEAVHQFKQTAGQVAIQ